jgi:hypothetical protein
MTLSSNDIEHIDRAFMRDLERDRMNERTQHIWPIFLSLSTVFGFIGLQNGEGAYLVGLFAILVSCLAQHVHDSELTLKKGRKYLYQQEQAAGCTGGAEQFFRDYHEEGAPMAGNKKALRRAFVVTSLLASFLFISHLWQDHVSLPFILIAAGIELFACWQSFSWLTYWKPLKNSWKHQTGRLKIKQRKDSNELPHIGMDEEHKGERVVA